VVSRFEFVSFLSDYGRSDEFVGVCHGVILDLAPQLRMLDVTHDVPAFDVRAGALALARAVQYLPAGLVLAVVDPGVGTSRRCIVVEAGHGMLVGPDNGLLAPAVALLGGPERVVALENEQYQLQAPGPTFAGRDIMAPAIAHIANGVPLTVLGDDVDPASLAPGLLPLPRLEPGQVHGEVLWVDRFGNCQLNISPDVLQNLGVAPGDVVEVRMGDAGRRARWTKTFADAQPSELVLVVDSYGSCALAYDRQSAAGLLKLRAGSSITLVAEGGAAG
jgi:S-adenosyl-L-methionine hydrolase (adenosine-forming)